jgi:hypothetical protein
LIGKYLDSEITPSEQRLLDVELEREPKAKELLSQLQDLHEHSREVITSEVSGRGRAAEDIFERAWQQQSQSSLRSVIKLCSRFRFAAGVAAGLLIGLTLHFVLPLVSEPSNNPVTPGVFAQKNDYQADIEKPDLQKLITDPEGDVIRSVDWYSITDREGNQWLIEGLRENVVRPAAFSEGL